MLKFLLLTASLWAISILFQTKTALTRPLILDIDKPVCYMQTPNGEIVNLSSLCTKKTTTQPQAMTEQNNNTIETEVNETETTSSGQAAMHGEVSDANGNQVNTTSAVTCTGADCNAVITPVSP